MYFHRQQNNFVFTNLDYEDGIILDSFVNWRDEKWVVDW